MTTNTTNSFHTNKRGALITVAPSVVCLMTFHSTNVRRRMHPRTMTNCMDVRKQFVGTRDIRLTIIVDIRRLANVFPEQFLSASEFCSRNGNRVHSFDIQYVALMLWWKHEPLKITHLCGFMMRNIILYILHWRRNNISHMVVSYFRGCHLKFSITTDS